MNSFREPVQNDPRFAAFAGKSSGFQKPMTVDPPGAFSERTGMLNILMGILLGWGAFGDCPKRASEPELSMSQVMYQLGRSVRILGLYDGQAKTAPEVRDALQIGIDCAEKASELAESSLQPKRLSSLNGETRDEYLRQYREGLARFRDLLIEARDHLCEATLDLTRLKEIESAALKVADESHRQLF